ncbi:FACT complex subunit spt16 [Smittium culicis]|uniref:FACT complex subunit n=1 Tax=Smittium culicis TaxID=133412 RepID=A0A1R1Y0Q9_9FUNG|nr:FACT complex subunit spt16 [Smittium culicis]
MEVTIDKKIFFDRLGRLLAAWKNPKAEFAKFENLDAIVILAGDQKDEEPYTKTKALQNWLLGYEFPRTLMVLTKDTQILEQLTSQNGIEISVLKTLKTEKENSDVLQPIFDSLSSFGSKPNIGKLVKESQSGKFSDEWESLVTSSNIQFEYTDISPAIGAILSTKDSLELEPIRFASSLSSKIMRDYFIDMMADCLDSGTSISHEKLSENIENSIFDPKTRKKAKIPESVSEDDTEWCFNPIIQSGGEYNLSVSAISDEKKLHPGVILCSLGIRYQNYCSIIARSFLIDPKKSQEKNYLFLTKLQKYTMELLKPGAIFSDVYNNALEYINLKRPDLKLNFVKNIGFVTGIEFRDSTFVLGPKCKESVKEGMVISLNMGLQKLVNEDPSDSKSKIYALQLCDIIQITSDGCKQLTECSTQINDVCFYFNDEDDDSKSQKKSRGSENVAIAAQSGRATRKTAILASKFRSENAEENESQIAKRRAHQKELADKLNAEGLRRFSAADDDGDEVEKNTFTKFESYKRETAIPREASRLQIIVDERAESIILPINNSAVPFHISTLKNISKSDEGDYVYLRLNFVSPGLISSKKDTLSFADPDSTFVRTLTYRSMDVVRMSDIFTSINNLKKNQAKREMEKSQMADIVKQDRLEEIRGSRPTRLTDVFVRPGSDSKRVPGNLEIHKNGIKYVHPLKSDNRIEILFNNVKHMIFQPCKHELLVILHFHLKNPIMIGKKKVHDIQFYRDASDASFDETGNRKRRYRYGDDDELEAEQEERIRRDKLDREFKAFAEQLSEESNHVVEMDVPFYEAGFYGVPHRSRALLQPTVDCLVHLVDTPFFVISISDIELAHLERVQFGLKNFDIVFVFKNYKKPPVHVNTIPMEQLDDVKEWLDSVNIAFTEGPVNLNWNQIMKTVNDDPYGFFEDGGWSFLQESTDAEEESENEESDFQISEDELEIESSSDESDESEFDSESDSGSAESFSEGEDWDELEKKAKQYDEKNSSSIHDDSRGRSNNRSNGRSNNSNKGRQPANKRYRR